MVWSRRKSPCWHSDLLTFTFSATMKFPLSSVFLLLFGTRAKAQQNCTGITRGGLGTCGTGNPVNCTGSVNGSIGECSCVAANSTDQRFTCAQNIGDIGDGSCNDGGASQGRSCQYNEGDIGDGSCNDGLRNVCSFNGFNGGTGLIGNGSCSKHSSGETICQNNGASGNGTILDGSCNGAQGTSVCEENGSDSGKGLISAQSCNGGGVFACYGNGRDSGNGFIGPRSCNSDGAVELCFGNGQSGTGYIGEGSCNIPGNNPSGSMTCSENGADGANGTIGSFACNAVNACNNNKGTIERGCCNYAGACNDNTGTISVGTEDCGEQVPSEAPSQSPSPTSKPEPTPMPTPEQTPEPNCMESREYCLDDAERQLNLCSDQDPELFCINTIFDGSFECVSLLISACLLYAFSVLHSRFMLHTYFAQNFS